MAVTLFASIQGWSSHSAAEPSNACASGHVPTTAAISWL